jgi:hypothetical protein
MKNGDSSHTLDIFVVHENDISRKYTMYFGGMSHKGRMCPELVFGVIAKEANANLSCHKRSYNNVL